jgi:hypothetical protein
VVEKAAAMPDGVLPRPDLLQVAEDRPRAVEEAAALGLEAGISSLPERASKTVRCSGQGSTCRATKSSPSSVRTSRTAEENGHHSAW